VQENKEGQDYNGDDDGNLLFKRAQRRRAFKL
jgi:hypothetical protein